MSDVFSSKTKKVVSQNVVTYEI